MGFTFQRAPASGRDSAGRRRWSFLGLFEQLAKLQAGPVQTAADRSDRHAEHLGHGLVLLPFHVFHHQHDPVLRRQPREGLLNPALLLGATLVLMPRFNLPQLLELLRALAPSPQR